MVLSFSVTEVGMSVPDWSFSTMEKGWIPTNQAIFPMAKDG
jgi:hypothetical protein